MVAEDVLVAGKRVLPRQGVRTVYLCFSCRDNSFTFVFQVWTFCEELWYQKVKGYGGKFWWRRMFEDQNLLVSPNKMLKVLKNTCIALFNNDKVAHQYQQFFSSEMLLVLTYSMPYHTYSCVVEEANANMDVWQKGTSENGPCGFRKQPGIDQNVKSTHSSNAVTGH